MFRTIRPSPALAACALILSDLCSAQQPNLLLAAADLTSADRSFNRKFGEEFLKEYWRLYPDRALAAGDFDYAGKLIIPDEQSRAKQLGLLNNWLSQLHRFNPASLSDNGRSDWVLLNNRFETERWTITHYRDWEWNPAVYNVARPFELILANPHVSPEQRLRALLKRLEGVSSYYRAAKINIRNPSREHTRLAIEQNRKALELLGSELERQLAASQLRDSERALFARRLAASREAVADYVAWLESLDRNLEQRNARSARVDSESSGQKFAHTLPPAVDRTRQAILPDGTTNEPASFIRTYFGSR